MDNLESQRRLRAESISAHGIAHIVERALPKSILKSLDLLTGGAANLNYLLRFHGTDAPVVLRIYTRDPSACRREIDILNFISRQLPVPELIYADPEGDEDLGPHVLYRYAEGMTFQELKTRGNVQDMAEAAYAIGAALARLRTVAPAWSVDPPSRQEITDKCLCSPVLEQRLGGAEKHRLHSFVSAWLPEVRHLYREKTLVHGDFNNRNTIIKRQGSEWVVTGILDWEYAFFGSPLWDASGFICFERQARPCREPHFSRGFSENGGSLPQDWYLFSRALNALTATESLGRPDLPQRYVPELRELIVATLDGRDLR
jgi:aminoglycoside phosphotransferase (APT) family kinase protein